MILVLNITNTLDNLRIEKQYIYTLPKYGILSVNTFIQIIINSHIIHLFVENNNKKIDCSLDSITCIWIRDRFPKAFIKLC